MKEHLQSKDAKEWIDKGYVVDLFIPSSTCSEHDWCYGSKDSCEPYKAGDTIEELVKHEFLISSKQAEKITLLSEKLQCSEQQALRKIIDAYDLD